MSALENLPETGDIATCVGCGDDCFKDTLCENCGGCPSCCGCGADEDEDVPCGDCGESFPADDLERGLCPTCQRQRRRQAFRYDGRGWRFLNHLP